MKKKKTEIGLKPQVHVYTFLLEWVQKRSRRIISHISHKKPKEQHKTMILLLPRAERAVATKRKVNCALERMWTSTFWNWIISYYYYVEQKVPVKTRHHTPQENHHQIRTEWQKALWVWLEPFSRNIVCRNIRSF